MKKITAALICVFLIFSMISCKNRIAGYTPTEAYENAINTIETAHSLESISEMKIFPKDDAESVISTVTEINRYDGENIYTKTSSSPNGATVEGWYVDGMSYASYPGMKVKTPISKTEFQEKYQGDSRSVGILLSIDEDYFKGADFKKTDNGYSLSFNFSKEQYEALSGGKDLEGELTDEIKYTLLFDKSGNITGAVTVYNTIISELTVTSLTTVSISFSEVTVKAPENKDEFTLIEQ